MLNYQRVSRFLVGVVDGCLRLQLHLVSANHSVSIMVPCWLLWHCWPNIHQFAFAMVGATQGSAAAPINFFTCSL